MGKNTTLRQLFLSNNLITSGGGRALGGMLQKNRGIREVSVGANPIGDAGGEEIRKAIEQNADLAVVRLHARRNGLSPEMRVSALFCGRRAGRWLG